MRERLYEIVFEADTKAGRAFDIALLIAILVSVLAVMLESVDAVEQKYGTVLRVVEWTVTILFTIEYLLRISLVRHKLRYIFSFFGIVDLLSVLPTYLSLVFAGTQSLAVVRILRVVRVFRVLKLVHFLRQGEMLTRALRSSVPKITVFLTMVLSLVVIVGAAMYLIEGSRTDGSFTSIPQSVYWAIVTVTTVGYGDLAPTTTLGQILASLLMISGYAIIAVPTGIVAAELVHVPGASLSTQVCPECLAEGHAIDAKFCDKCGALLNGDGEGRPG